MNKTKIDWCDCTINPVVGCKNKCEYCYARKINDRFHFVKDWSEPQFFPERLRALDSKKGVSIFMNSMSDVAFWSNVAIEQTFKAIKNNPQHNYIFLTKSPNFYLSWNSICDISENIFIGSTITINEISFYFNSQLNYFLSIEPLLSWDVQRKQLPFIENGRIKQVIIGAETGARKNKVIPKIEWVRAIVNDCDELGIPVFMKESLKTIMKTEFRQDKLIWQKEKV